MKTHFYDFFLAEFQSKIDGLESSSIVSPSPKFYEMLLMLESIGRTTLDCIVESMVGTH